MAETIDDASSLDDPHVLAARHAKLERMLDEELARPRPDDERLAHLKRAKLAIKDRMQELAVRGGRSPHAATA